MISPPKHFPKITYLQKYYIHITIHITGYLIYYIIAGRDCVKLKVLMGRRIFKYKAFKNR